MHIARKVKILILAKSHLLNNSFNLISLAENTHKVIPVAKQKKNIKRCLKNCTRRKNKIFKAEFY